MWPSGKEVDDSSSGNGRGVGSKSKRLGNPNRAIWANSVSVCCWLVSLTVILLFCKNFINFASSSSFPTSARTAASAGIQLNVKL